MFRKIKNIIENKRTSSNTFWRTLVWIKDFIFYRFSKKGRHYVVVCNSKKFMFVCVFKNASSSLRKLAYENDQVSWKTGETQKKISLKESKSYKYKDYIKFVVYRDPVERFLSLYKNKILGQDKEFEKKYKKNNIKSNDFKTFIIFAKKGLNNKIVCDPHLLPQHSLYKASDVDYVVPIDKLNSFIKNKLNCDVNLKINSTNNVFLGVDKEDLEEIKKIYSEDYKIKPNY